MIIPVQLASCGFFQDPMIGRKRQYPFHAFTVGLIGFLIQRTQHLIKRERYMLSLVVRMPWWVYQSHYSGEVGACGSKKLTFQSIMVSSGQSSLKLLRGMIWTWDSPGSWVSPLDREEGGGEGSGSRINAQVLWEVPLTFSIPEDFSVPAHTVQNKIKTMLDSPNRFSLAKAACDQLKPVWIALI